MKQQQRPMTVNFELKAGAHWPCVEKIPKHCGAVYFVKRVARVN